MLRIRNDATLGGFRIERTQAEAESARRPAASRPNQQLTGQVSSQDNQYQCGQPLLQFGIVAPMPITSPMMKNQRTCRPARRGAKRAQSQAQRIETATKNAVLAMRAWFDGTRPGAKSPGNRCESNGSVARTRTIESRWLPTTTAMD